MPRDYVADSNTPETSQVAVEEAPPEEAAPAVGKTVTLDKNIPEIADAFAGCKVGDKYTVTDDNESEIVLEKEYGEGEPAAPEAESAIPEEAGAMEPEPQSGVERLMAMKRRK